VILIKKRRPCVVSNISIVAISVGLPVVGFRIFDDRTFRASFSDFRKLINAFHFLPRNNGEEAAQVD